MAKPQSSGAPTRPAISVDPDAPIPFSLTPAAEALARQGRMVPARIAGNLAVIPCEPWCTIDHVEQDAKFAEDVFHASAYTSLTAPGMSGGTEDVLGAWITAYPFSPSGDARPYLALDAAGSGATADLSPEAAVAFADQLTAHAERIRDMARQISGPRVADDA